MNKGKKGEYQFFAILLPICGGYYALIRFAILASLLGLMLQWYDLAIFFVLFIGFVGLYWIVPLYKINNAKDVSTGIDFHDAMIQKGKREPDNMVLPIKDHWKINVDFTDTKNVKKKMQSRAYEIYLYSFTRQQIEKSYSRDSKQPPIETLQKLNEIEEKLEALQQTTEVKPKEELEEERERLSEIIKSEGIDATYKNYEELNFETLEEEDLSYLKDLELHYVQLDDEMQFSFEEESFEELYILTPGPYAELLDTHKEQGSYEGWYINLSLVFTFYDHWFSVSKNVPVLYLRFSQNMGKKSEDLLEKLSAEAMAFIQLQVMQVWVIQTENKTGELKQKAKSYQYKADLFEKNYSDLIQEDAEIDLKYSRYFSNKALNIQKAKAYKYEKRSSLYRLGLVFASVVCIVMMVLFFIK
jgi:hypothetical protein